MTAEIGATGAAVSDLFARSAKPAGPTPDVDGQWQAFVTAGFPWAAVPEERGGPGGTAHDAVEILREIGRAAASVPTGDTDLLGDWLLRQADLPAVPDLLCVAQGDASDDLRLLRDGSNVMLTGTAHRVAWASRSGHFVALLSDASANYVVRVPIERLAVVSGESLAGEPRDLVTADAVPVATDEIAVAPALDIVELRARGAAIRTVLIQGAVDAVVELVSTYCGMREQFGRRLRDFQVVAHQLALMRERAALVSAAAELASATLNGSDSWEAAATAKVVAGEVAGQVATTAHQLHGAIGVSEEYALHRYTRRLWAWRDEYGNEYEWAHRLGTALADRGPNELWPWIVSSDDPAG
ncbi:acyl-CoA dehydrogenase family protein [Mycolicibacterium sp. XJ1819]